ncbi:dihydrofolate reductase family protein [Nocardia sp. NPDC006044]|uniref:dihydrofolate reductase family protein n=1 Tax=Nocardia sp. NPDC006044 TaxID=3364306 RepID=UPI0036C4FE01
MGTVTLWMQMSLDGFAEGPDHTAHWPVVDEELCASFLSELSAADTFLYGRKTYELMASFWPTADSEPAISPFYIEFARCWKAKPKIVFSRTLHAARWNTRVVSHSLLDEVRELRTCTDDDMILFGGAQTASTFMKYGLIDRFRLFLHPMLLGSGTPLFAESVDTSTLQLVDVITYDSAVVQVQYQNTNAVAR